MAGLNEISNPLASGIWDLLNKEKSPCFFSDGDFENLSYR